MAYITPALLFVALNVLAALGVLPWVLRRKRAGKSLRIRGTTNLSTPPTHVPILVALFYNLLTVLAFSVGGAAMYGLVVAFGGDLGRELVVACELAIAGAALGVWSSYCCWQMVKDNPDHERMSRNSGG